MANIKLHFQMLHNRCETHTLA